MADIKDLFNGMPWDDEPTKTTGGVKGLHFVKDDLDKALEVSAKFRKAYDRVGAVIGGWSPANVSVRKTILLAELYLDIVPAAKQMQGRIVQLEAELEAARAHREPVNGGVSGGGTPVSGVAGAGTIRK